MQPASAGRAAGSSLAGPAAAAEVASHPPQRRLQAAQPAAAGPGSVAAPAAGSQPAAAGPPGRPASAAGAGSGRAAGHAQAAQRTAAAAGGGGAAGQAAAAAGGTSVALQTPAAERGAAAAGSGRAARRGPATERGAPEADGMRHLGRGAAGRSERDRRRSKQKLAAKRGLGELANGTAAAKGSRDAGAAVQAKRIGAGVPQNDQSAECPWPGASALNVLKPATEAAGSWLAAVLHAGNHKSSGLSLISCEPMQMKSRAKRAICWTIGRMRRATLPATRRMTCWRR